MSKPMTLKELQAILGERIKRANTESDPTERKAQNEQSQLICSLAKQMINNADVILRAEKLNLDIDISNSVLGEFIK